MCIDSLVRANEAIEKKKVKFAYNTRVKYYSYDQAAGFSL